MCFFFLPSLSSYERARKTLCAFSSPFQRDSHEWNAWCVCTACVWCRSVGRGERPTQINSPTAECRRMVAERGDPCAPPPRNARSTRELRFRSQRVQQQQRRYPRQQHPLSWRSVVEVVSGGARAFERGVSGRRRATGSEVISPASSSPLRSSSVLKERIITPVRVVISGDIQNTYNNGCYNLRRREKKRVRNTIIEKKPRSPVHRSFYPRSHIYRCGREKFEKFVFCFSYLPYFFYIYKKNDGRRCNDEDDDTRLAAFSFQPEKRSWRATHPSGIKVSTTTTTTGG